MNTKTRSRSLLYKKILSVLILTAFIIILFLIFHRPQAQGQAEARSVRYISVQVEEGDSLWSLAEAYKSPSDDIRRYIDNIRSVNGMHTDTLIASEYLIIPLYS